MARSADPLRREDIAQQARGVGATLIAPSTNPALQLASSLREISPEANRTMAGIAERGQKAAAAQAKRDALVAAGAKLGDAVREGVLEPTSNPWYVQAYSRESAAVRGQAALSQIQIDSATWAEKNDPQAFAERWRREVGGVAEGFQSPDEIEGFTPVESQFTQQALQSNVSQNVTRITTERDQNASALLASDLGKFMASNGGVITADQAGELFRISREGYVAVGGQQAEWNMMAVKAITSAAYSTQNASLLDLLKAPELVHGPSGIGAGITYGDGVADTSPEAAPIVPIPSVTADAVTPHPAGRIPFPVRGVAARVTGGFGEARKDHKHNGLDIAVPVGTPVVSPGSGKVIATGFDKVNGHYVRIDHGNGTVTSYAHLSQVTVKKGDVVGDGVQVALSGNTGRSSGPHVHWVVRQNGVPVDPRSAQFTAPTPEQVTSIQAQDTIALAAPPQAASTAIPPRGPSLYDIAGVADQVESDRYRIQQARESAQQERLRALTMEHKIAGTNAYNSLYEAHGTALLTGEIAPVQLIREMEAAGYKPQAIAQALSLVRGDLQDNAGVATARLAINGSDPQTAKQVMDLQVEAARSGLTDGMEERVGALVLKGVISGDDGAAIITRGINRSRGLIEEGRADANYAETVEKRNDTARAKAQGYKALKQKSGDLAGLVATRLLGAGIGVSPKARAAIQRQIADAAAAHLAINPGDFAGAEQVARTTAATLLRRAGAAQQGPRPNAPSGNISQNNRR